MSIFSGCSKTQIRSYRHFPPIRFDLISIQSNRVIGGCAAESLFTLDPDGRNAATFADENIGQPRLYGVLWTMPIFIDGAAVKLVNGPTVWWLLIDSKLTGYSSSVCA